MSEPTTPVQIMMCVARAASEIDITAHMEIMAWVTPEDFRWFTKEARAEEAPGPSEYVRTAVAEFGNGGILLMLSCKKERPHG